LQPVVRDASATPDRPKQSPPGTAEPERADSGSKVRGRRLPAGASRMPAKFLRYVEARDEKAAIEAPVEEFRPWNCVPASPSKSLGPPADYAFTGVH